MTYESLLSSLARCLLEYDKHDQTIDSLVDQCAEALGHRWRWLRPLVRSYLKALEAGLHPHYSAVTDFIHQDDAFQTVWQRHKKRLTADQWAVEPRRMQPVAAADEWPIPKIETARDLADWFWLQDGRLEWYADLRGLGYRTRHERLRHYGYRILEKSSGGLRLIEAPKQRLKEMQRQILDFILTPIPAHPSVHGFIKGRSIQTFAAPHAGQQAVVRMDIQNFFPTFPCARIQAIFRTMGYPKTVADLLGGICTTSTPKEIWKKLGEEVYSRRHLPQGSPSSPALANLCAYRMDCRLAGLAQTAGAQYTRYADDLAFSGDSEFARGAERFSLHVSAILIEEGFRVRHRKTRIMRAGVRQHLAGLVVNERVNIPRHDFDELKAILTNCVNLGPENQNRNGHPAFRSHLDGRIGYVETVNAARGARLREIFHRIKWPLL